MALMGNGPADSVECARRLYRRRQKSENEMEDSGKTELVDAKEGDCGYIHGLLCLLEQTAFGYELFKKNYLDNLMDADIDYFVIEHNHEKCGFISIHRQTLLHHNAKIGEIQEFIIEERFRKKGIGSEAIRMVKEKCKTNNVSQLEVCTNKKRVDTQFFYRSNHFIESHFKFTMSMDEP
jgi:PhnO protein